MAGYTDTQSLDAGLDRLEGSRTFSRSGNQVRLLRFLLKQAQEDSANLKETYIGSVFYSRPASYDPQLDSIVRVNVSRLRLRLQEYYEAEGRHDLLRIDIPLGSYVPVVTVLAPQDAGLHLVSAEEFSPDVPLRRILWMWPVIAAVVIVSAAAVLSRAWHRPKPLVLSAQQQKKWILTPGLESEIDPAISPDGRQMAYVSRTPGDAHYHIFLRPYSLETMAGKVLEIRDGDVLHPAWSPDARQLAFLHCSNGACAIETYSFGDSSVHLVRKLPAYGLFDDQVYIDSHDPRPVWTRDGKAIIFPYNATESVDQHLLRHDLATGAETPLIPNEPKGDDSAAVLSPDGRSLAYLNREQSFTNVMIFDLGAQTVHTAASHWQNSTYGLTWTPDGQSLIVSSDRNDGNGYALWRIPLRGEPMQIVVPVSVPMYPVFSPDGKMLLALEVNDNQDLVLADDRATDKAPVVIYRSRENNVTADIAPDGKEVAMLLYNPGGYEVWIAALEHGTAATPRQLTHGLQVDHASSITWSPDGSEMAIASTTAVGYIALVDAETGEVSRLQTPGLERSFFQGPVWAADGESLYLAVSGSSDGIYRISTGPVPAVQKIVSCAVRYLQGDGDQALYYEKKRGNGIFRVSLTGDPTPQPVQQLASIRASRNWKVADGGLYYLDLHDSVRRLHRLDLRSGKISTVTGELPRVVFMRGALDCSPREHAILYSQWSEDAGSQIDAFPME